MKPSHSASKDYYLRFCEELEHEYKDCNATENNAENGTEWDAIHNISQNLQNIQNDEDVREPANDNFHDTILITNENNHNMEENISHVFDICRNTFDEKLNLIAYTHDATKGETNILKDSNTFSSLACTSNFTTEAEIINYDIKTHDSEVNYKACNKIDCKTNGNYSKQKHVTTHSDRKYQCAICNSKLSSSTSLRYHMRTHTGEKPFECTVCGSKFRTNSGLTAHMRIHTGDKPYECTECGVKFANSSNLKEHLKIHTGEQPFKCTVCASKFTRHSSLKKHMKSHSGDKPHVCGVCGIKFSRKDSLYVHMRKHSGINLD
ncbi:uncharacterized protein [Choristoneura fumiferana]|uniref:uncharacterized protein n=1 Tax=Choristoneura fumiferana TaxID=7141 RepID=UPI003D15645C